MGLCLFPGKRRRAVRVLKKIIYFKVNKPVRNRKMWVPDDRAQSGDKVERESGGSARRKGRGTYTATQETRRPYGRRVLPQKRGEGLAAAATTMVVLAAVVITAEQDEDDDEQNPGAVVATKQILQAHTGRPPFFGTHSIIRGGREVVTANRHPAAETGFRKTCCFFRATAHFRLHYGA